MQCMKGRCREIEIHGYQKRIRRKASCRGNVAAQRNHTKKKPLGEGG